MKFLNKNEFNKLNPSDIVLYHYKGIEVDGLFISIVEDTTDRRVCFKKDLWAGKEECCSPVSSSACFENITNMVLLNKEEKTFNIEELKSQYPELFI